MRYTIKHLRWWHVWNNVAKTVVSSQATQEAAELVAYELNKGVRNEEYSIKRAQGQHSV